MARTLCPWSQLATWDIHRHPLVFHQYDISQVWNVMKYNEISRYITPTSVICLIFQSVDYLLILNFAKNVFVSKRICVHRNYPLSYVQNNLISHNSIILLLLISGIKICCDQHHQHIHTHKHTHIHTPQPHHHHHHPYHPCYRRRR